MVNLKAKRLAFQGYNIMWVIDIRHLLDETQSEAAAPQLRNKVKKISEIITYATSLAVGLPVGSRPKCWRRPSRKPCNGVIDIGFEEPGRIYWICPECQDEGIITGWQGLIWDMTDDAAGMG